MVMVLTAYFWCSWLSLILTLGIVSSASSVVIGVVLKAIVIFLLAWFWILTSNLI